jgi:hypothetical protein
MAISKSRLPAGKGQEAMILLCEVWYKSGASGKPHCGNAEPIHERQDSTIQGN